MLRGSKKPAVRMPSVAEDKVITAAAKSDPDALPLTPKQLKAMAEVLNHWPIIASGTEGYRTAEVTLGGVDTQELSSSTMESTLVPGLYFIGEVMDVTGHLGGYNFQWAWACGHAAGLAI